MIRRASAFLTWMLYRDVTVYLSPDGEAGSAPQLTVSNHFGGLADPLLVMSVMRRRPRIVARDVIWKFPVVGRLMNWVGAIPVHKPEDSGANRNDEMFGTAYESLREGNHLVIFPEGVTRDDPSIAPVKTGAARVVLGARAHGTPGIQITPVGIHYDDKAALRSRVFINIGAGLDLDSFAEPYELGGETLTAENHDAVRALTNEIERRIRDVAPDFADWPEATAMAHAASVYLRSKLENPMRPVAMADRERLAGILGGSDEAVKAEVVSSITHYGHQLDAAHIDDRATYEEVPLGQLARYVLRNGLIIALLFPFAIIGFGINLIPLMLMWLVGRLRYAPAMMSTVKPLAAVLFFGVTWAVAVWGTIAQWGVQGGLVAVLLMPVYLVALIVLAERLVLLLRSIRWWFRSRRSGSAKESVIASRQQVVDAVTEGLT